MKKTLVVMIAICIFTACSDDASYSMQSISVINDFDMNSICDEDVGGTMVYAKQSSSYFYCDGKTWINLVDYADVESLSVSDTVWKIDTLWRELSSSGTLLSSSILSSSSEISLSSSLSSSSEQLSSSDMDLSSSSVTPSSNSVESSSTEVSSSSISQNICGGKEFSYLFKFCYNDSLYTLCEGEKYNPESQLCYNNTVVNLVTCGDTLINPSVSFCTEKQKVEKLCNGLTYNTSKQKCENGTVVTYDTCGTKAFNNAKYFCDNRDKQTYSYVTIGKQVWMAQNLNYASSGSKCYEGNSNYCKDVGRLYTNSGKNVCPSGWRLPTAADFSTLVSKVGGSSVAGTHLKSTEGWGSDYNGKDNFGFNAKPSGYGYTYYSTESPFYYDKGSSVDYWMGDVAKALRIGRSEGTTEESNNYSMYSIRCIRDQ